MIMNGPIQCLGLQAQCLLFLVFSLLLQCEASFYDNPEQGALPSGPNADEELHRKWDHEVGSCTDVIVHLFRSVYQCVQCSGASPVYPLLHT